MSAARTYFPRAPRYIYRTEDSSLLRFAEMDTKGVIHKASLRDLSESGFSFALSMNSELLLEEGELLKVEVPLPGRKSIACFATIVRVDEMSEWDPEWGDRGHIVVGLQFRNLPAIHLRSIRKSLEGKVEGENDFEWNESRRAHTLAFTGLSLVMGLAFYVMSIPPTTWISFVRNIF